MGVYVHPAWQQVETPVSTTAITGTDPAGWPAGASLDDTDRMVSDIERILREIPEVETTSRRTGMELGLAAVTEANRGDISERNAESLAAGGEAIEME